MIGNIGKLRFVFLDIDGCLTSIDDGSSFLLFNPDSYRISERLLGRFLEFLERSDAHVVISSNWRRFPDDGEWVVSKRLSFKNHLPELRKALGKRYMGTLPAMRWLRKSEALRLWGEEHDIDFGRLRYVIIDDDESEGFGDTEEFSRHYIQCDPQTGLTEENLEKAFEILNHADGE